LTILLASGLSACGSFDKASNQIVKAAAPYKMDIVQGNVVTREQMALLSPGMSRIQVRDIMGTPLLVSVFHASRWDYVFSFSRQNAEPQIRKVAIFFKDDLLERFEADVLPTEAEFVASLDARKKSGKPPLLEAAPETLDKFIIPVKPAEPRPLPPLPTSYPPLEPPGLSSQPPIR
jgi:outer membrane protein assembly factor BamE